jgi:hypothetical protein
MEISTQLSIALVYDQYDQAGKMLASWLARYIRVDAQVIGATPSIALPSEVALVIVLPGRYSWPELAVSIAEQALANNLPLLIVTTEPKLSRSYSDLVDSAAQALLHRLPSTDEAQFRLLLERIRLRISDDEVGKMMYDLAAGSE